MRNQIIGKWAPIARQAIPGTTPIRSIPRWQAASLQFCEDGICLTFRKGLFGGEHKSDFFWDYVNNEDKYLIAFKIMDEIHLWGIGNIEDNHLIIYLREGAGKTLSGTLLFYEKENL